MSSQCLEVHTEALPGGGGGYITLSHLGKKPTPFIYRTFTKRRLCVRDVKGEINVLLDGIQTSAVLWKCLLFALQWEGNLALDLVWGRRTNSYLPGKSDVYLWLCNAQCFKEFRVLHRQLDYFFNLFNLLVQPTNHLIS